MLLLIIKVKTFNKASSSLKSVVVLLRGRFDKLDRKKSESELIEAVFAISITNISLNSTTNYINN